MKPDIGALCREHLEFMKWADEIALGALSAVPSDRLGADMGNSFASLLDTLTHVYLGEMVWLKRVQGNGNTRITEIERPADLAALAAAWPELHRAWIEWSGTLSGDAWYGKFTNRNMDGLEFETPYWQLVMHLVNHGSYHRGQVATMLRQNGIKPPGTDLILFYRSR